MNKGQRHPDLFKHMLIMLSEAQVKLENATEPKEVQSALKKMDYYYEMIAHTSLSVPVDDELKGICYFFGDTSEETLDKALIKLRNKRDQLRAHFKVNLRNKLKEITKKGFVNGYDFLDIGIGLTPYNRFVIDSVFKWKLSEDSYFEIIYRANRDIQLMNSITTLGWCRQFKRFEQKALEQVVNSDVLFIEEYLIYFNRSDMLQKVLEYKKSIGIEYLSFQEQVFSTFSQTI